VICCAHISMGSELLVCQEKKRLGKRLAIENNVTAPERKNTDNREKGAKCSGREGPRCFVSF
jgi:hypothetical protein